MGIKIGVFDAAEYGGMVEFSLKPLPSENFFAKKNSKNAKK